jgi:hypothetical protein
MRSEVVVIACVGRKDPVEMGFAEDDLWPAERGSNLRRSLKAERWHALQYIARR